MHIRIIKVGKTANEYKPLAEKFHTFLLPNKLEIIEVKSGKRPAAEAEILAAKIDSDWPTVLLTEHGKNYESQGFAEWIEQITAATGRLQVVIGGAMGFPAEFRQQFEHQLSLSALTFPHDLAFVILLEQIYRARTIINGKTYHY